MKIEPTLQVRSKLIEEKLTHFNIFTTSRSISKKIQSLQENFSKDWADKTKYGLIIQWDDNK
jgi:hypothetical protein